MKVSDRSSVVPTPDRPVDGRQWLEALSFLVFFSRQISAFGRAPDAPYMAEGFSCSRALDTLLIWDSSFRSSVYQDSWVF